MGVSKYNKIFNWTLALVILYDVLALVNVITDIPALDGIISKTAVIFLIFAIGTLVIKCYLALKNFIGSKDTIINLIVHLLLIFASIVLVLV